MTEPGSDWFAVAYATVISLCSVSLGVVTRYSHKARRLAEKIDWKRLRYELPTIVGLTIITGPVSAYVKSNFGVNEGVTAATAFCLGYLGTRFLDIVANFLEKKKDED